MSPFLAQLNCYCNMYLNFSDEYSSYPGEKLIPQKSGYMLASTAALRLVPGAKKQILHRVGVRPSFLHHPVAAIDFKAGPNLYATYYDARRHEVNAPI